jgi:hypothetical protein
MKTVPLILLITLLAGPLVSCKQVHVQEPPNTEAQQQKITELESQLKHQHSTTEHWQMVSVSLGAGCLVLLIIGTALGAKTRHDATHS